MDTGISRRDAGHSFSTGPSLNPAGVVYTTFITAYTGILIYSLCMLWLHRKHPSVRIRGFFITCAALIAIHVYVAALFIVYPLNGWYKCGSEFWYMSIIFPLGVALFQAANVKLMAVSREQQELAESKCCWAVKKQPFRLSVGGLKQWYRELDYVTKTYVAIGGGMAAQLIVTFVLFFGSRRFNPDSGFFGEHVSAGQCRTGAEWVPSVIWQFLWTWVFGPVVLYKTRHIKDTHNWALQTRITVIAGLPGTPMWLGFLYATSPKVVSFNTWWPPAMWFAPGLIAMQISSLFIPFYDIWRHRDYSRPPSQHSSISDESTRSSSAFVRKSKDSANNWEAFEHQLKHNIQPLFWFAATKDFTAENILFLREVREFKRKWRLRLACPPNGGLVLTQAEQRDMFEDAARIYFELVCPSTSRCYINVDGKINNALKETFKDVAYEPPADTRSSSAKSGRKSGGGTATSRHDVAPWESPALSAISRPGTSLSKDSEMDLLETLSNLSLPTPAALEPVTSNVSEDFDAIQPVATATPSIAPLVQPAHRGRIISKNATAQPITVPTTFSLRVFDKAEDSIKYLVYTNTWKSFSNGVDASRLTSVELVDSPRHSIIESFALKADDATGATSNSGVRQITDAELYDMDLEMQDTPNVDLDEAHDGVLDHHLGHGPVPLREVDARCASCRRKAMKTAGRVVVKKM